MLDEKLHSLIGTRFSMVVATLPDSTASVIFKGSSTAGTPGLGSSTSPHTTHSDAAGMVVAEGYSGNTIVFSMSTYYYGGHQLITDKHSATCVDDNIMSLHQIQSQEDWVTYGSCMYIPADCSGSTLEGDVQSMFCLHVISNSCIQKVGFLQACQIPD